MMYLITKCVSYHDEDEALKMFNHYKLCSELYDDDKRYLERIQLISDDGEILDECKRYK